MQAEKKKNEKLKKEAEGKKRASSTDALEDAPDEHPDLDLPNASEDMEEEPEQEGDDNAVKPPRRKRSRA